MAEVTRTTQGGKVLVAGGDPPIRVTQAGIVYVAKAASASTSAPGQGMTIGMSIGLGT
jgi:hypothetical protein